MTVEIFRLCVEKNAFFSETGWGLLLSLSLSKVKFNKLENGQFPLGGETRRRNYPPKKSSRSDCVFREEIYISLYFFRLKNKKKTVLLLKIVLKAATLVVLRNSQIWRGCSTVITKIQNESHEFSGKRLGVLVDSPKSAYCSSQEDCKGKMSIVRYYKLFSVDKSSWPPKCSGFVIHSFPRPSLLLVNLITILFTREMYLFIESWSQS